MKFQEDVLDKLDKNIQKHNYNSRTEFIREAVRDKLASLSRDELIEQFMKLRGKFKGRTPLSEDRKIREEVSKELEKELDNRFR